MEVTISLGDMLLGGVMLLGVYLAYLCGKDAGCLNCKDWRTQCEKD
jgi:hypothetical protein